MFRTLRRHLRRIRYYSATQQQTIWSRANDIALVATLVLTLPVVWLAELSVHRVRMIDTTEALLFRDASRQVRAVVPTEEGQDPLGFDRRGAGLQFGRVILRANDQWRGWPIRTVTRHLPLTTEIDDFQQPAPVVRVLARDDPIRQALDEAMDSDHVSGLIQRRWDMDAPTQSRHWLQWLASAMVWWIMLFFASAALLNVAKFMTALVFGRLVARETQREASGQCWSCGYDLRGLEFNERCPECGALV